MPRRAKPIDVAAPPYSVVMAALVRLPGATRRRVAIETTLSYGRAARTLDGLALQGHVIRRGRGGRHDPFWYIRSDYPDSVSSASSVVSKCKH